MNNEPIRYPDHEMKRVPITLPWTWGMYGAIRYLAGSRKEALVSTMLACLVKGFHLLARETLASHTAHGKPVPQRLAEYAREGIPAEMIPTEDQLEDAKRRGRDTQSIEDEQHR